MSFHVYGFAQTDNREEHGGRSQDQGGQFEEVRFKLRSARSSRVSWVRREENSEIPCSQGNESGQCRWRTGGCGGGRGGDQSHGQRVRSCKVL